MASPLTLELMFNNLDVAIEIINLLDFNDLLNMIKVCRQFEDIIINYLWKSKYRQVEVIVNVDIYAVNNNTLDDIYDVMNDISYAHRENRLLLNRSEIQEFLCLNANNIENFAVMCSSRKYDELDLDIAFPNLKSLLLYEIPLTDKNIKFVMDNCPKLENLIINACSNSEKGTLVIGEDIKLETLEGFANLKSFALKPRNCYTETETHLHKYEHIHGMLSRLKAQRFCIDEAIFYPYMLTIYRNEIRRQRGAIRSNKRRMPKYLESYPCEELELGQFFDTDDFVKFYNDFLSSYVNISQLTIKGSNRILTHGLCIPKMFFKIANESCKRLTKLTLKYSKIGNFIPINTLKELTLFECKAMSWMNFRQILSEMNLSSFVTYRTYYRGKVEPFTVSKSLRHFEFDFPERFLTGIFKEQFQNLTSFTWKNAHDGCIQDIASNFPNLQKLSTVVLSKLDDGVFKLTSLQSVKINFHINVSVLMKLLKHPTLQILLFGLIRDDDNEENSMELEVPKTNLANLSITSTTFMEKLEFWLDLLSINPHLTIISKGIKADSEENVFTKLVKSTKFPPNRKSIKVGGFIVDCEDLKNNFDANMKRIKQIDNVISGCWLASNIVF